MASAQSVRPADILASAVDNLSLESRLKVLRVADDLIMHILKSGLPTCRTVPDADGTPAYVRAVPASAPVPVSAAAASAAATELAHVQLAPVEKSMLLTPKLGVLRIDYNYHAAVGDIDHPASFAYEVEYETVAGLTYERCQEGELSEELGKEFRRAVAVLHEKGCDVITGDCGFMLLFQDHTVASCGSLLRPSMILLSPLCQLPTLITGLHPRKKVAIMTANSASFPRLLRLLKQRADVDISENYGGRYVVIGCQDVPHFGKQVANGEPVIYDDAEPGLVKLAQDALLANPEIDMFVLECSEMPQFANTLRFKTGRPVYTAITLANMAMAGRQCDPRCGRQMWARERGGEQQRQWDGGAPTPTATAPAATAAADRCAAEAQISRFAAAAPVPEADMLQALAMLEKL